jgi:soluble lytic murein transglycosylase-like protein
VKLLSLLAFAIAAIAQTKPSDSMQKQLASVATQREAVRKQVEAAELYRSSPVAMAPSGVAPSAMAPAAIPEVGCEPLPPGEIAPLIDAAAQSHKVQAKLLRAVVDQESASVSCAVSPKGAQGLMQLMPATIEQFHVTDPFDAKQNVEAGAQYLKQLLDKYKGDLSLALAAYNAGSATVDQAGGIPDIKETKDYVGAILKKLKKNQ